MDSTIPTDRWVHGHGLVNLLSRWAQENHDSDQKSVRVSQEKMKASLFTEAPWHQVETNLIQIDADLKWPSFLNELGYVTFRFPFNISFSYDSVDENK